jgi:hypothetical protein
MSGDQCIVRACEDTWEETFIAGIANKDNCSGFIKAVAQRLNVPMSSGNTDAFVIFLAGHESWKKLDSGSEAKTQAETGHLVLRYRPEFPVRGFADLEAARTWGHEFVRWYNCEHRHSGIRYVTPAQRHAREDSAILAARHQTYLQARERNPARWSGNTRDWSPIGVVTLNPERNAVIRDLQAENKTRLAA